MLGVLMNTLEELNEYFKCNILGDTLDKTLRRK